ncbi:hypothetical protein J1605_016386 [Eschrichtius robustus]|uniref:Exonuclease domain-containing protein n=1 Tax=Eschrichtius robustus TaxID=9764 RepID=A0AB34I589_ESCRO|nr:hypothetical protein J1605_016386 [Eschrichtius robustus]
MQKSRLSAILFAGNREISHGQLCELLKRAVLGKFSVPKPRKGMCSPFYHSLLHSLSDCFIHLPLRAFELKFCLPPPSSDFLADIIGLQKKQIIGDLPKEMEGSLPSSSSKVSINLQNDPIVQKYGSKKVSLTRCLLTKEEMKTYHFPLQGFPDCENFVPTKCCGSITDNSPLFGLDCEMCLTSKGRELTRISLVAEGGCCVMDELVKPDNKIVDYLTRYFSPCLQLSIAVRLEKDIQCPDRFGHDATEDARTALELAQYFLKYGPKKIAELNLEALASHQELEAAGLEPKNTAEVVQQLNTSVLECLDSMGQKLLFLTREADATELSSSKNCQTIKCLSNKEVSDPVSL